MTNLILIAIASYLIGSFPTAYLLVKNLAGQDIRKIGSGNIGAMNTVRALKEKSKKLAVAGFFIVLIIDMAKGALAVFLAQRLVGDSQQTILFTSPYYFSLILAGFFVVLGHNYSVFLKFAGGRGAASLIGILVYFDPLAFLVWGLPIVICTILAQIILEKIGFEAKINWKKISAVISIFGKQMAGRLFGLILGPLALYYFYQPEIFLPIAVGTILLLIKNISRFRGYFLGEKTSE